MFSTLQNRFGNIFEKLKGKASLSPSAVEEAMGEIRIALLEADVSLPIVKTFIEDVKGKALEEKVLKSVTPGQQVVKIVNDALVEMLKGDTGDKGLNFVGEPPYVLMVVGLQGSGKTTSTAKIGRHITKKMRKKVLMASLDVARPAAQEQLAVLGKQTQVSTLPIIAGQSPVNIAKRAVEAGKLGGYDVVILDTAGRLSVDEQLMNEVSLIKNITNPKEVFLVADSMAGQDTVQTAQSFHDKLNITGVVLTRVDGDSRGGVALSLRSITGCPIRFMGIGEKVDEFEAFDAERVASRILGMGDIVALVEKAQETTSEEEAQRMADRMMQGQFDLNDLKKQLQQMQNMGGIKGVMSLMPGMGKMKDKMANAGFDEKTIIRQIAVIDSMTKKERSLPKILHASRKKRIATGSGTSVQDVNKLLKQFQTMEKVMKQMRKMGGKMPFDMNALSSGNPFGGKNPMGGIMGGKPPKGFGF